MGFITASFECAMWYYLITLILSLLNSSAAPPPENRPRTETCLVQTNLFKGIRSACDAGDLHKLSAMLNMAPPRGASFGAESMADVILSRSGIFDDQLNLEHMHICSKHRDALGSQWEQNRPTVRRKGERFPKCNMPALHGFTQPHGASVIGRRMLQKEQSIALWRKLVVFVPLGTGKSTRQTRDLAIFQTPVHSRNVS